MKIAEVDYFVNSIVMTIGIQKDEVQKKLAAMQQYKQRYVEALYLDTHNPLFIKAKEKGKIDDRSIVDRVSKFSGAASPKKNPGGRP
jgi:hypothetical protein